MDNDIRILIGLTDLNVDFDPKAELRWFTMVPKWLLIKGHVAHSSFKTIESESKNFYARNVDTCPLRTSLTFNQTTISSIRLNKPQQWN